MIPVPAVPIPSAVSAELFAEVARLGLGEQFPEVIALTRELSGDFTVDISEDPEIYNCVRVDLVALAFQLRAVDRHRIATRLGEVAKSEKQVIFEEVDKLMGRISFTVETP